MKNDMVLKKQGLTLTINNGKSELDDATITISWEVDEKLCLLKPKYALILVHDETNMNADYLDTGRRKLVKMSDKVAYLQMHRPGKHTIYFTILNPVASIFPEEKNYKDWVHFDHRIKANYSYTKSIVRNYLDTCCKNDTSAIVEYGRQGIFGEGILVAQKFELDMPGDFFSHKPKTGIPLMFYNMVNTWRKFDPLDDCEFRKRVMLSFFTLHFLIVSIGRLFMFISATLVSVAMLLARIVTFIVGFRPANLFTGLKTVWSEYMVYGRFTKFDARLRKYDGLSHRVWKLDSGETVYRKDYDSVKRIPFSPLGLGLVLLLGYKLIADWQTISYVGALFSVLFLGFVGTNILLRIFNYKYTKCYDASNNELDPVLGPEIIVGPSLAVLLTIYWFWFPLVRFATNYWPILLVILGVCAIGALIIKYRLAIGRVLEKIFGAIDTAMTPVGKFFTATWNKWDAFKARHPKTVMVTTRITVATIGLYLVYEVGKVLGVEGITQIASVTGYIIAGIVTILIVIKIVFKVREKVLASEWWKQKVAKWDEEKLRKQEELSKKLLARKTAYDLWQSGQPIVVKSEEKPCDICEDRTLTDSLRLTVNKLKPKVCKPYGS